MSATDDRTFAEVRAQMDVFLRAERCGSSTESVEAHDAWDTLVAIVTEATKRPPADKAERERVLDATYAALRTLRDKERAAGKVAGAREVTRAVDGLMQCMTQMYALSQRAAVHMRYICQHADLPEVEDEYPFDPLQDATMRLGDVLDRLATKGDKSSRLRMGESVAKALHGIERLTGIRYHWRGERVLRERQAEQPGD